MCATQVENEELEALRGGRAVLLRDTPLISFEVHVHATASLTTALLRLVHRLGYGCFLVDAVTYGPVYLGRSTNMVEVRPLVPADGCLLEAVRKAEQRQRGDAGGALRANVDLVAL